MRQRLSKEYIAGLFDGEGSIGIYSGGSHTLYMRTQLVQNRGAADSVLGELKDRFGGWLAERKRDHVVNWQLTSKKAVAFLKFITPALRLKKDQAQIALSFAGRQRPMKRNARGHVMRKTMTRQDYADAAQLKALKRKR